MERQKLVLVVLLAPPGSGKGTLSELLKERNNFFVLSAGKIFRSLINKKAEKDDELKDVNKGKYLADDIVDRYMIQELENIRTQAQESQSEKIYIALDGYPRTIGQAQTLEKWAKDKELVAVKLEGLDEVQISERLNNRYLCEANEHIFNALHNFPQNGICPRDGSKLIKRKDDSEAEIIKKRLEQHELLTEPIWKYFQSKNIPSIFVNSSTTIEKLYSSFRKELKL